MRRELSTGKNKGSSNYTGSETAQNLNPSNATAVTVKAKWTPACGSGITCETLNLATNGVKNIAYSGTAKGFILNKTGRYKFEVWGASGGDTASSAIGLSAKGGRGAYASGVLRLTEPTTFYAYVGGAGSASAVSTQQQVSGGWNGGGPTGGQNCCARSYGSGGGASDFRFLSGTWSDATSLRSRIIVAAGGGGSYTGQNDVNANNAGGNAGKINGFNGTQSGTDVSHYYCFGTGASQTAGGSATTNCNNASYATSSAIKGAFGYGGGQNTASATGGGGGWYGGGRSGHIASAGGGSSYISGLAGFIAVKSKTDTTAKCAAGSSTVACSLSWTGYTFSGIAMLEGNESMTAPSGATETGHSGNGYARITYLGT